MPTITPNPTYPVAGAYAAGNLGSTDAYSGTFIPTLWSKKLNVKFFQNTILPSISNTNWEGEIKGQGDTVIVRTAPSIAIRDYTVGTALTADVPVPITAELQIDKGKYFAVNVNDVLAYQADVGLMEMFTDDAAKQLKIQIENECFFNWFVTEGPAAGNEGATAGAISAAYDLGTEAAPEALNTTLDVILRMSAALDEQNVPEEGRFLVMTPQQRNALMASNIAQAYFTGDSSSIVRTGKIGMLDRFEVYVSNLLPKGDASKLLVSGLTDPATGGATTAAKRALMVAGHKSACTFASQISNTETIRNQTDFGDIVRGLAVYGRKVIKPEALVVATMVR
jgi:hypothetical protein